MKIGYQFFSSIIFLLLLFNNAFATEEKKQEVEQKKQEIPFIESTNLELLYSDEGIVVLKMTTEKRLQYENGDSIYPAGVYVEFYDKAKNVIGSLRANTVYQYADKDVWELKGDVEVKGFKDGHEKQLNTEELYWNQKDKQIYTPKFVRIETENELVTGYGLSAMQDLSYYNLSAPQGFVNIDSTEIE